MTLMSHLLRAGRETFERRGWARPLHSAPFMKPFLTLMTTVLLLGCSPPCAPFDNGVAEGVCHRADAGALVANQPFELNAAMYASVTSCAVVVDGGSTSMARG